MPFGKTIVVTGVASGIGARWLNGAHVPSTAGLRRRQWF
jgi:hypothetical protein